MSLDSTSASVQPGRIALKFLAGFLVTTALVLLTARVLYAALGYFVNREGGKPWLVCDPSGCHKVYTVVPWYQWDFKLDWFLTFGHSGSIRLTAYMLSTVLWVSFMVAAFVVFVFYRTMHTKAAVEGPSVESFTVAKTDNAMVIHVEKVGDETDDTCRDLRCRCKNHHTPRPDLFVDGEWRWQPSCTDINCACAEHLTDDGGDTFAPELIEQLTWGKLSSDDHWSQPR